MSNPKEQFLAGIISKGTYITESSKAPSSLLAEAILMEGLWSDIKSGVSKTFKSIKSYFTPERNLSYAAVLFLLVILLKTVKNPDEVELAAKKAIEKAAAKGVTTQEDIKQIHKDILQSAKFGTAGNFTAAATRRTIGPVLRNAIEQELGISKAKIEALVKSSSTSTEAFQKVVALIDNLRETHPEIDDTKMDHIVAMILNTSEVAQYDLGLSAHADDDKGPTSLTKAFTL